MICLKATADGGRQSAVDLTRYRPDVRFHDFPTPYWGVHPIVASLGDSSNHLEPGEESSVAFFVRHAEMLGRLRLRVGSTFDIIEGGKAVGFGTITSLC
jgi:hypothetical protein